jgi:hypothetical protein
MSDEQNKSLERSVDSLKQIYAVIIALAISFSVQNILIDKTTNSLSISFSILGQLPAFFTFIFVIIPFYHGMNRHLDICYVDRLNGEPPKGALIFDIFIFFLEASILFAVAASIRAGLTSFIFLGILLILDLLWASISAWIHYRAFKPSTIRWALINIVCLAICLFVLLLENYPEQSKIYLFLTVAFLRAIADYWSCWKFYFPD